MANRSLPRSSRFAVTFDEGDPPTVTKRGDVVALSREAQALSHFAGSSWLPGLVDHQPGRLVSTYLPGTPRNLARLSPPDARALGALLACVHKKVSDTFLCTQADYPGSRVLSAAELARRAGHEMPVLEVPGVVELVPIHGDLVAQNILWGPRGPGLIDWEFFRLGDPAEDLAYLIALNDLREPIVGEIAAGYGNPEPWSRVAVWTPIVRLEAAAWYALNVGGPAVPVDEV